MLKENEEGIIDLTSLQSPFSEEKNLTDYLNAQNLTRFFKFCENPEIQEEVLIIFLILFF